MLSTVQQQYSTRAFQTASNSLQERQEDPLHGSDPTSDPAEDSLLQDLPDDFFQDLDLTNDTPLPTPYSGPPQPPPRLQRFIARHPYIEEPLRHDLGAMDQICPYCQAASWEGEIPSWCCDKGKTDLAQSESNIDPDPSAPTSRPANTSSSTFTRAAIGLAFALSARMEQMGSLQAKIR